jgi:cell division protein FtsX
VFGERAAAAQPATHEHLRPVVRGLGENRDFTGLAQLAMTNLPVLLMLTLACMSVGTLVYARTATREGEIAVRSALGASRARIIGQLFVEGLVLASVAAAIGLIAADRAVAWGIENINRATGGAPFWMTPGLKLSTILYGGGLAAVSAALVSLLPALKATQARVQQRLANLGAGGATLRFGRVWTGVMIAQVAVTAIAIPTALEGAIEKIRNSRIRAEFPSQEYLAARIDMDRPFEEETTPAFEERRAQTYAALERRIAQEPGVVAVTFADRAAGSAPTTRVGDVESSPGAEPTYADLFWTSAVGPGFFEAFDRPIVAGRTFHEGDRNPVARTVIVNEAFAREYSRDTASGSPIGARLQYEATAARSNVAAEPWFEIVGVVRDFGLDPDDEGDERPFVFHAASAGTVSPLVMSVHLRGNPASLAARLPVIAAGVDARVYVGDAMPLNEWVRQRDRNQAMTAGVRSGVTVLVLFLSALGIFSLMSVSVSRRTREIGLRAALGASPRQVLAGILSRGIVLIGSGTAAGGALLLLAVAVPAPPDQRADDLLLYAGYVGVTAAVMLAACLLACIGPARRALGINPIDALRVA